MRKSWWATRILLFVILGLFSFFFLAGCEVQETPPEVETNQFNEGTYTGYSDATDNGYAWAEVTIRDGNVTKVELMEITEKGNEKDYDTYTYKPSVEAYQEMPERFENADSADVETYTGATDSSEKYKQAVSRALDYARGGVEGKFYEGTFQGESKRTDYGYAVALVTIKDEKMNNVELKEINTEGEFKDFSNYDYEPTVQANEEMAERFVEANSTDVDLFTGSTQSSIRYKEAVENALRHARKKPEQDVEDQ